MSCESISISRHQTRRELLQGALGLGYALAAAPIMAQTAIHTPFDGLHTGEVMLERDGFKFPLYVAHPQQGRNWPVVLVISEIFGVHEYIADVARRWAHLGYCALAPELFARQGEPSDYATLAQLIDEVVSRVPDAQVMADLDACVTWAGLHGADAKRLGVNGFCWGGRMSWLYAAHNPALKAAVSWYGRLEGERSALSPSHPMDLIRALKAPVLGLYGQADESIPQASVQRMQNALAQAASLGNEAAAHSKILVYPNAGHAFHADYRASFEPLAAQQAWAQATAWFKRWL
jgi:carboxymethylenebutenolidase